MKLIFSDPSPLTVAEVLDLTHDHSSPFRLQFDDKSWEQYLSSLKPLGLAILLNTCNMETQVGKECVNVKALLGFLLGFWTTWNKGKMEVRK